MVPEERGTLMGGWKRNRAAYGRLRPTATVVMALGLTVLALAACGSSSSSSTTTTAGSTSTSTSGAAATTSTAVSTSTTTTTAATVTPVPCPSAGSATVCEFYSPTQNISCEIDPTTELCLTLQPPQAAHLAADGTYTTCTGATCLSNAGVGTQSLAYGTSTSNGTFTCVSRQTGMTCTAAGKGYTISTSGIQAATA
jgi:hypothetical protein